MGKLPRPRQLGFTYLGVLFLVALVGLSMASVGTAASHERQREKEAQLLFVGHQFREAIRRYHEATPGAIKHYPPSIEALLKDPRTPAVRRHLRRIYPDPITGKAVWGLVEAPGGGIMGVFSQSTEQPLKTGGFREVDQDFEGKASYAEWKFVYVPPQVPGQPNSAPNSRQQVRN